MQQINILQATTLQQYQAAGKLISEYLQFLGEDLSFQQLETEMATLPSMYGGGNGCLLLAEINNEFIGMVALRKKSAAVCEMKRLFVRSRFLGSGIGKILAVAIIEKAKQMGFAEIMLDTLQRLEPALHLYKNLGFVEIPAYYENPLQDVVFMKLEL